MNSFRNISNELKVWLGANPLFNILLPLDIILLFAGLAVMVLQSIFKVNMGGLISSLAYWAFILGLLLTYVNFHLLYLYIGLFGYSAFQMLYFIISLIFIKFRFFSWSSLFAAAIYGGLGYLVFKYSTTNGQKE